MWALSKQFENKGQMFLVNFVNCFLLRFGVDMCVCVTDVRCALFKTLGPVTVSNVQMSLLSLELLIS